jgi:CDP-glucose 4,6-dehydratase
VELREMRMENLVINKEFWYKKKVLITGHTGFKGSWLSLLLYNLGSEVHGYALEPPTDPGMFKEAGIKEIINSNIGDIRDYSNLLQVLKSVKPDIVIHMAAQSLVMESYKKPLETFSVNVMGTVTLLEAIRQIHGVKAVINVTSDKCYENREWIWGYRENEPMGGYDPYSSSKGCSELITGAYRNSFFNQNEYKKHGIAVASVRAGNVIGGGDWAEDRLIPDFIRAVSKGKEIKIRSPYAIRPWQHVLEPLTGYLILAEKLYNGGSEFAEAWNFGPDDTDTRTVEWIAKTFCDLWGDGSAYKIDTDPQPHEAGYLKLDCSKAKIRLGWFTRWDIKTTIKYIVEWNKSFLSGANMRNVTLEQIETYYS